MKILALTDSLAPWHSFYIRFGQYIKYMPWEVKVTGNKEEIKELETGDILFFYRFMPHWKCLEADLKILKNNGIAVITDLDDCVWEAPIGWNKERKLRYTKALREADIITCSTADLQCLVKVMFKGKTSYLIRNSGTERNEQVIVEKNKKCNDVIRVCWTGCPWTRPDDLALLKPLVKYIEDERIHVIWRHIGHAEGRLSFADAVGVDPKKVETVNIGSHQQYLRALEGDIGLAPVAPKCFNSYKSEIKLLEYGSKSMAWIASDTSAYRKLCERWGVKGRLCQGDEDDKTFRCTETGEFTKKRTKYVEKINK